ncbi:complement factor D-like isoform X2 [Phymastichus coffea]|uniref:complement factor D-like isoform X2 n=1 Tax=Phymastichus coffea TaxID=108790 RepID=UPI00273BA019|nr:complement factor D-like isoform X2 [Phymastichus coffea]
MKKLNIYICFLSFTTMVWSEKVSLRIKRAPIINGQVTTISKKPYFASIVELDNEFKSWCPICGATIITAQWLLTAAHCIQPPIKYLKVRTGTDKYFIPKDKEELHLHEILAAIPHPDYSHMNILKIPIECRIGLQMPINLPTDTLFLKAGTALTIVGFGFNTNQEQQDNTMLPIKLLYGTVRVMEKQDCQRIYEDWFIEKTDHHFCATSQKFEVAKGDSGGPAVYNSYLIGIISSGGQGKDQYPGLFIDVRKFIGWIKMVIGIDNARSLKKCCAIV